MRCNQRQAKTLLIKKRPFFKQLVCPHIVAVIGGKYNKCVFRQAERFQLGKHTPHQVIDHRHISPVARRDLRPFVPVVGVNPPITRHQSLNIGPILQGIAETRVLWNGLRVVHRVIRFWHDTRTVRPPEIGPDKKGIFFLRIRLHQLNRFRGDHGFEIVFNRSGMEAVQFPIALSWISLGIERFYKLWRFQILLVQIVQIIPRNLRILPRTALDTWHIDIGRGIAISGEISFTAKSPITRILLVIHMPLSRIPQVVSCPR